MITNFFMFLALVYSTKGCTLNECFLNLSGNGLYETREIVKVVISCRFAQFEDTTVLSPVTTIFTSTNQTKGVNTTDDVQTEITTEADNRQNGTSKGMYYTSTSIYGTTDEQVPNTTNEQVLNSTQSSQEEQNYYTVVQVHFGDGFTENITLDISCNSSTPFTREINFQHGYQTQGIFSVVTDVTLGNVSKIISERIQIWDKLSVTLTSMKKAEVNQIISFDFISPPSSNFYYEISYGDGQVKSNTDESLQRPFTPITWTKTYKDEGLHNVTLQAWNPIYKTYHSYTILIEYPIPGQGITLEPTEKEIPLPDGWIEFILIMNVNVPSPSNVFCTYDYTDGKDSNIKTRFRFMKSIKRNHQFRSNGLKLVKVYCNNSISSYEGNSQINVKHFIVNDFVFTFMNPVKMDMQLKRVTPTENYRHFYKPEAIPVIVTFWISLFNISRFPPDIEMVWNFGDGTQSESLNMTRFYMFHQFKKRGTFKIHIHIKDIKRGLESDRHLSITMGTVQFTSSRPLSDLRTTVFDLTAEGLPGLANYTFNSDSDDIVFPNPSHDNYKDNINVTVPIYKMIVRYSNFGLYIPFVIGWNETVSEIVYLDDPLIADYDLNTDIQLIMPTNHIHLPPGDMTFSVTLPNGHAPRPYVHCIMIAGDAVDRLTVLKKLQNITSDNPLVFHYTYTSLGHRMANVSCSNYISDIVWKKDIYVNNNCFSKSGMFDRQYSIPNFPMRILSSQDSYLTSRMLVYCKNQNPSFQWRIYHADAYGTLGASVPFSSSIVAVKGRLFIRRGVIDTGLFYVSLNVSMGHTWIFEYTYLKFESAEIYASITGGQIRYAEDKNDILLNAIDRSRIDGEDYGESKDLQFRWSCMRTIAPYLRGNTITIQDVSLGPCNVSENAHGMAVLNTLSYTGDVAVTVTAFNGNKLGNFTQIITKPEKGAPVVSINCIFNCGNKASVSSKISFVSECSTCSKEDVVDHEWRLYQYDGSSQEYIVLPNFSNMTSTGINKQSLVIHENMLEANARYLINLNAKFANKSEQSNLFWRMRTTSRAANGMCETNTRSKGYVVHVSIACFGWEKDNDTVLRYRYETITKRQFSYGAEDIVNVLYEGSESTISEMPLQVGDPNFGNLVNIRVLVYDEFENFRIFNKQIDVSTLQNNVPGVDQIRNNFQMFLEEFCNIVEGGNDMNIVRLIGAVASTFIQIPVVDKTTTEEAIMTGVTSVVIDTSEDIIVTEYRNKVDEMVNMLNSSVGLYSRGFKNRFSLADIQQILSTIDALTRYPHYLSFNSLGKITMMMDNLMVYLLHKTNRDPIPLAFIDGISLIAHSIHRVLESLLDKMLPAKVQNLEEELSLEEIKEELIRGVMRTLNQNSLLGSHNGNVTLNYVELNRKADFLFEVRRHRRKTQLFQRDLAEEYFPVIKRILRKTAKVIQKTIVLGEKVALPSRTVLELLIRRVTFIDLKNDPDEYFAGIRQNNQTEDDGAQISISVSNFRKNPYIYGANASSITSDVPIFDVPDNMTVDSRVKNRGDLRFKRFIPLINPAYSEKMIFFTFDVINDDDAAIIFIKPDDIEHALGRTNIPLYTFYLSSTTYPTSDVYDFKFTVNIRDWSVQGFKVFVQRGVCGEGICYMGIKPLEAPVKKVRRKRSTLPTTTTGYNNSDALSQKFLPVQANFSLIILTTGCRTWNDDNSSWIREGCQVLPMSDLNETVCRCAGNTFSTTFYVPPNLIDFLTVWSKFDASNASVYGTLIAVLVVYVVAAIPLRKEDKKDIQKLDNAVNRQVVGISMNTICGPLIADLFSIVWAIHFPCDHDSTTEYFYLVTVYTGMRRGAGTSSNVSFVIVGDNLDTGIRTLSDGITQGFSGSSVRSFIMGSKGSLGCLTYMRIWHDNSGLDGEQGWYLNKITVDDLQNRERFIFACEMWLALDEDDGMIERILPVSSTETILPYQSRFIDQTQSNITEHHLWLSLLMRPRRSYFTRVQRLSCLLVLLNMSMITNAMFFRSSSEGEDTSSRVNIAFMQISTSALYVSFIGIVISTPPILFIAFLFKNRKLRKRVKQEGKGYKNGLSEKKVNGDVACSKEKGRVENVVNSEIFIFNRNILPHWAFHIAWTIVVIAVLVSSFFLILYSMEWGKAKSEEWLTSFILSFVESLFIVDPIKVIILAIILALMFKTLTGEEVPDVNIEHLKSHSRNFVTTDKYLFSEFENGILSKHEQLSEEHLRYTRKKHKDESVARAALKDIILFAIYIFAIYSLSFIERDRRAFIYKNNIENHLLNVDKGFKKIKTTVDFIEWMNTTFIPTYYPEENFNSESLTVVDRQWFGDLSSIRVGPARLRQVRMKSDQCSFYRLTWPYPCIESYSEAEEDTNLYCLGWGTYNVSYCNSDLYKNRFYTSNAWKYTEAKDIWGVSKMGEYQTYSGGGYLLKFVKDRINAFLLLQELVDFNWINRNTRAIFLEFTMYNPNTNLFSYALFLAEFSEVGGVFTWTDIQAFKPLLSATAAEGVALFCYVIILLYLIFSFARIVSNCKQKGCLFFLRNAWNIIESLSVFLGFSGTIIYVIRMIFTKQAMQMFYDDKLAGTNNFINFGHIIIWDNVFNVLFATLVFLSTLYFLKILGYNKKFTEILTVVANAGTDILAFGFLFLILFISFAIFGHLLFGAHLEGYKSFFSTCGSLANSFIGRNKLDSLVRASPQTAQLFFMTYSVCVIMVILTMFAALLNQSISEVRAETMADVGTVGIVEVFMKSCKTFLMNFYRTSSNPRKKCVEKAGDDINPSNVLALIRKIVTTYDVKEEKQKKYSMCDDRGELIPSTERTSRADDVYHDLMVSKSPTESLNEECEWPDIKTFKHV